MHSAPAANALLDGEVLASLSQDSLYLGLERRNIFSSRNPDELKVNAEIVVNQLVPHPGHFSPWDI